MIRLPFFLFTATTMNSIEHERRITSLAVYYNWKVDGERILLRERGTDVPFKFVTYDEWRLKYKNDNLYYIQ